MGIAQLLFKKGNEIAGIELDVIIEESANASATITSNPVENGSDVNDHIIINPMSFSMTGVVSDTKAITLGGLNTITQFTKDTTPSQDAWEDLLAIHATREVFTLETNLRTYDNVVIESLSTTQNKDSSNSLTFTASLKEIIFVGNGSISADQFSDLNTSDKGLAGVKGGLKL